MSSSELTRLTQAQLGIWLGHQRMPAGAFHAAECLVLDGPLDVPSFERALETTLAEASALHVAFVEHRGEPRRLAKPFDGAHLEIVELPEDALPSASTDDALRVLVDAEARRPLDLERGQLFRHRLVKLGAARHAWIHVAHHIALDGFGFQLIAGRVAAHYSAAHGGSAASERAFDPFEPVLAEDEAYEASNERVEDRLFWARELGARRAATSAGSAPPARAIRSVHHWSSETFEALRATASVIGTSWIEALLALVSAQFGASASKTSFVLGMPVMLRLGRRALRVPCTAMNMAALPVDLDGKATVADLARDLRASLLRQRRHQRYRYEHLRLDRAAGLGRVFGPVVNVLPFDVPARFGPVAARLLRVTAGPVEDLSVAFSPYGSGLEVNVDRHPELFSADDVDELVRELTRSVDSWISDPSRALRAASSVRRTMSVERADDASPSPIEGLARHARQRPNALAVVDRAGSFTYAELDRVSRRCAQWLRAEGASPGEIVAFQLPRGLPAIALIVAALRAGNPYVAIDPALPASRRQALLERVAPRCLVALEHEGDTLALSPDVERLELSLSNLRAWAAETTEEPSLDEAPASGLAYVVLTSGSTGEPKGVAIGRRALSRFLEASASVYRLAPEDRVLQFASLSFDASVEEVFGTFAAGATLVLRDDTWLESPEAFLAAARRAEISVLDLPTAFWHELAYAVEHRGAQVPSCVRMVIIGGEAASPRRVRGWTSRVRGARLVNTYGPSEATVVATTADLDDTTGDDVPIGRPLPGVGLAIVDASGAVVDGAGALGELYLLGPTLAEGYLGRDDLTAARFVMLPGRGHAYRTGDLVEQRSDGQLLYRGRVDDELKLSGYRIAPAEVEAVLSRHPRVRDVIVHGESFEAGAVQLVAHVESDHAIDTGELRELVAAALPAPMVPSRFEWHARLPRTSHGKIDRGRLRSVSHVRVDTPVTAMEAKVLDVWRAVLGVERIGLDDDFFALGGHSLKVIQLANRLSERGAEIRVAEIFRNPTPRAQARLLSSEASESPSAFVPPPVALPAEWFVDDASPSAVRSGRVLLTGANGVVGIHLLESLLANTDRDVVCIVRGATEEEARRRLVERAQAIGLDLRRFGERVHVEAIDLAGEGGARDRLASRIARCDAIVHSAAQVSLTRSYESLAPANVGATRELIGLAARWRSELHFVSSIATLPALADVATEEAFYPAHEELLDGYQCSKWHAEALCEEAGARGLSVAVYRLGRVTGACLRPSVHVGDLVWRVARAAVHVGAWPDLAIEEPWIPADEAADAMVRLLSSGAAGSPARAYHLTHTGSVSLERVFAALLGEGYPLTILPLDEWMARVNERGDDEDRATVAVFGNRTRRARKLSTPRIACTRTITALSGQAARHVDAPLLSAYCRHAWESGFLPPPPGSTKTNRALDRGPDDSALDALSR